ncbi:polysaccharide deacetylase family protein, PEP-CTERM locus subfamily [Trichlorobacter thiogenes]|uniref:Polysaccharide deacetylase family protein, PEP-CTERM locus subfamily n=1 Tax=Trichlorobacter thiogenes TaxID=115783 RepID=A0A1T4RZ45_9BACT|nr:polysaccharide deacetylase family protein, PEP-CTERM locus subfamily [Trichlorobacter thiogenes]
MTLSGCSALTIDVEDWYHVCGIGQQTVPPRHSWRVAQNVEKIVALLEQNQIKATFFMLGSVAKAIPELAPMIVAKGHEIASHGYSHTLLTDMDKQQFLDELRRTEQVLIEQTGKRPVGYRAPQWSVSPETPWVDELLAESGYLYDSSRNPLPFVGDAAAPRYPYRIDTPCGSLWEVPPLVTKTSLVSLPTGGGWGFRLFPLGLISATIEAYMRDAAPAVLYLHPREIDPDGPRLQLPLFKRFLAYGMRTDATSRLANLLQRYCFMTLEEMVRQWQPAS